MRRFAPLLVVAACSGSADDANAPNKQRSARIPSRTTYVPVRTGGHGSSIETLAVSDDGTAALSQDAFGGTRLWPSLDGRREPVIVAMPEAVDLAVAHDATGYTLAARDTVGGLELVRTASDGRVTSRARIGAEPAIEHVAIAAQGVIVSRADQTLDVYDVSGVARAHLVPAPGSRVLSIVSRNDHVMVIVERDRKFYGRWLADAAWGSETVELPLDTASVPPIVSSDGVSAVLSPSGTRLAVGAGGYVSLVDPAATQPVHETLSHDEHVVGNPLGFLDDNTLLVTNPSRQMTLYTLDGRKKPTTINAAILAIGDGVVVTAAKDALELTTADHTLYLGYAIGSMKRVAFHREALAIGNKESQPRPLDANLAIGQALVVSDDPRELADAMPLDDGNVLALHALNGWYTVSIVDPRTKQTVQALNQTTRTLRLVFDPKTQLLVMADAKAVFLVKRTPATRRLDLWFRIDVDNPMQTTVYLTDPEQANGAVAMVVRSVGGNGASTVRAIRSEDLVIGKPVVGTVVFEGEGYVPFVDRAGHVFSVSGEDVVEHAGTQVIATYAGAKLSALVPSPDGAYIAAHGASRIQLYKRGGGLVWEKASPLVSDLGWIDGSLVGVFAGGLGKLDLETGAFDRRACGWSFGLGTFPPHDPSEGESVCDAR